MSAYFDGGFLLVLLARTHGTQLASSLLREVSPPVGLNFLHQLQVENMLIRFQKNPQPNLQINGNEGLRLWRHYLGEGVFSLVPVDWDAAFRNAITWNQLTHESPPSPWLFLHPALALTLGATHFYSFDPRSRAVAHAHGLALQPASV